MATAGCGSVSDSVRGYPLRAFVICLIAYTTAQMDLALFGYAVPAIRAEFGLTLSEVMAIVSAAFLFGGALLVVLGWLADRVGRLPLFQFSLLGSSFLVALISIAPGVATLTALRGASIAVGGLSYPITGAIITEEMPARLRGLFMGLLQIGYPLGWALASLWSMWLLTEYGWRQLFWVGLVSLPMVWVVRRYLREPPRSVAARSTEPPPRFSDLFATGVRERAVTLFIAQFLFVWAYAASIFLFPSFLREVRALDAFNFSLLIGAGNAIGVLGYVLAAWIGERVWTRRNTVVLWTLLGACLFQVLVWVPTTFGQILFVYALMSMFFYGSAAVKFAYLAEVFPTRIRALAMACCGSLAVTLGSAAGPYTVSLAIESWGWHLGYATLVGLPLALAGLLYLTLDSLPSGLEVEDIVSRIGKEAQPSHG